MFRKIGATFKIGEKIEISQGSGRTEIVKYLKPGEKYAVAIAVRAQYHTDVTNTVQSHSVLLGDVEFSKFTTRTKRMKKDHKDIDVVCTYGTVSKVENFNKFGVLFCMLYDAKDNPMMFQNDRGFTHLLRPYWHVAPVKLYKDLKLAMDCVRYKG